MTVQINANNGQSAAKSLSNTYTVLYEKGSTTIPFGSTSQEVIDNVMETPSISKVYIYKLVEPDDLSNIKYIGITSNPLHRLQYHVNTDENTLKSKWIQQLKSNNTYPVMIVFDEVKTYEEAYEKEIYYISQYQNLLNMTSGGDGAERKKISQYTKDGTHVRDYNSIREAANVTGYPYENLQRTVAGTKFNTYHDFIWIKTGDVEELQKRIKAAVKVSYTAYFIDGTILTTGSVGEISEFFGTYPSKISLSISRQSMMRYNGKESVLILPDDVSYEDVLCDKYTLIGEKDGNTYKLFSVYHAQLVLGGSIGMISEVIRGARHSTKYNVYKR